MDYVTQFDNEWKEMNNNNFIVQGHAQKIFRLPLNIRFQGTMLPDSPLSTPSVYPNRRTIVRRSLAVFSSFTNCSHPAL
jgi:hypothetical protein